MTKVEVVNPKLFLEKVKPYFSADFLSLVSVVEEDGAKFIQLNEPEELRSACDFDWNQFESRKTSFFDILFGWSLQECD